MAWTRRMGPLLLAAAVAMAGIAIGAQLQRENALPSDVETQQLANRGAASGNVVFLSSLAVAAGATGAVLALAPPSSGRSRVRPILALLAGAYLVANLAQTAWPNYSAARSRRSSCRSWPCGS